MKAIVYNGMRNVDVENVEDPKIEKNDDIIVKVTSTAICGSDLHLIHGMIPNMPKGFRLGHETMGIVEEVGKDVVKVKKNDRVIIPFPVACGHCCYCEHGNFSQCDNSNPNGEAGGIFGYSNTFGGYDGGQAEDAKDIEIPADLKDVVEEKRAELIEAVAESDEESVVTVFVFIKYFFKYKVF